MGDISVSGHHSVGFELSWHKRVFRGMFLPSQVHTWMMPSLLQVVLRGLRYDVHFEPFRLTDLVSK